MPNFRESVQRPRWTHVETFRKLPYTNAAFDPGTPGSPSDAELGIMFAANPDWEYTVSGGSAGTPVQFLAGGGIQATADGDDGDTIVIGPRTTTLGSAPSALNSITFDPAYQPRFATRLVAQTATLTATIGKWGLALTGALDTTTDDDQAYFYLTTAGTLQARVSIGGTDTVVAELANFFTAAGQEREIAIKVDDLRRAVFYYGSINGDRARKRLGISEPLTAGAALKPWLGNESDAAAEKSVGYRHVELGVDYH